MLEHSSGIHDFTQNVSSEDWDAEINEPMTSAFMLDHIAEHPSDFLPGTSFNYSNSNYLLLGYIIEQLDGNNYGLSLSNRIATKLGLTSTYFGVGALDSVANKAYSYRYDKQWQLVDEGEFSGLIPAGAGGIVGTVQDMVRFIEALFGGQLISENSLQQMLPTGDAFYGLGIMQFSSQEGVGYGHTGGYKASESSLVYYPADSLTIAYATNGIVLRKEDILRHVHDICKGKPFAVSMNRCWQAALVFGFGLVVLLLGRRSFMQYASAYLRFAGLAITVVFWLGQFLAGRMHAKYDPIRDALTTLDSFYSASGTFMAGIQFSIALLMLPFAWQLYRYCRGVQVSVVPVLSIFFIILSLVGTSLFPFPNALYSFFANVIILSIAGPFLVVVLWRKAPFARLRWLSTICFLLMLLAIGLLMSRPVIPEFVHHYWGAIQRQLYLGWTFWLTCLGLYIPTPNAALATKMGKEIH